MFPGPMVSTYRAEVRTLQMGKKWFLYFQWIKSFNLILSRFFGRVYKIESAVLSFLPQLVLIKRCSSILGVLRVFFSFSDLNLKTYHSSKKDFRPYPILCWNIWRRVYADSISADTLVCSFHDWFFLFSISYDVVRIYRLVTLISLSVSWVILSQWYHDFNKSLQQRLTNIMQPANRSTWTTTFFLKNTQWCIQKVNSR